MEHQSVVWNLLVNKKLCNVCAQERVPQEIGVVEETLLERFEAMHSRGTSVSHHSAHHAFAQSIKV